MESASAREKDLGMDYTAEVSSESLFLCRQGNMARRMTKEKKSHSFIPFRSFVTEIKILFSAALDCPKGFEDSCGSRGVCLKDPYMTHIRDCKCFRGHYFNLPPGYCIGKHMI